jgi:RimJ/RimL family protein N-acetyltransferase
MPKASSTGQGLAIAVGPLALIDRILSMSSPRAVRLRSRSEDDFDVLFRIADDLATWEERSAASPAPLTGEAFRSRLAQSDADDSGKDVSFVIDVDGAAVGSVSLFDFDELARHAEVGIALVPEARGNGIGTAAISQIVEFAFVRCNLRRVHLQVIESNLGAIRAYEKAGFVVEGRLRQHAWVRGKYEDIVVMGILRSAWDFTARDKGGLPRD